MLKKQNTPRSRIRAAIRAVWLRSRERAAVLRRDCYTCQECGKKKTKAGPKENHVSVEVHHTQGIDWDNIIDLIANNILETEQVTLCKDCHKAMHYEDRNK